LTKFVQRFVKAESCASCFCCVIFSVLLVRIVAIFISFVDPVPILCVFFAIIGIAVMITG
jgi:hypothetical protein